MRKTLWVSVLTVTATMAFAGDPFADVKPGVPVNSVSEPESWWRENLLFRKEIYWAETVGVEDFEETDDVFSRLSAGFEIQKRFATATKTVASIDYQGRVVFRDHWVDTAADPMGMDAGTWEYETHSAYVELYNLFGAPGQFNLRAGRFYQPFGLNSQTDTHGTLLQLSNDRVFGTERDWQLTAYGNATEHLDYMAGYVLGTGSDQELDGQGGMGVGRIGLNNEYLFEHGLEGGLSGAYGERLDPHVAEADAVATWRLGADMRKRLDSAVGPFTLTGEGATGEDEDARVWSGLAQADWLNPGRRWGVALQYSYFERGPPGAEPEEDIDERASLVLTRYFRNDVGNSSLHWLAGGLEQQIQTPEGEGDTLLTVQYYRYW
jgi:hypothetical protein